MSEILHAQGGRRQINQFKSNAPQARFDSKSKNSFTSAVLTKRMILVRLMFAAALAAALAVPAKASSAAHKLTASPDYIELDPFMVSVIENFKVKGFLVLEFALHVTDRHQQDTVDALTPKIRDTFVRTLMEYGAKVATVRKPPDLDGILARLQADADAMLGPGTAKVLVTQALVRPI